MSVHGYLADASILYCNLKLGLLKLQEETAGTFHADIDQDDVFLAGLCSWSRSLLLFHPSVRAPLLGDNTRLSGRFPNPSASRGRSFCTSSSKLLGSMSVMFLRGILWPVGAVLFIFN